MVDDGHALAEPHEGPPLWLRVRAEPDVPLEVESVPADVSRDRAHPSLHLTLAAEHAKRLEEVTTKHLGDSVALVMGGEVMTTHHIRAPIRDGRIQITRCHDDACERILVRLKEQGAR